MGIEIFCRFLEFGFNTHFYGTRLSIWIQKPLIQKGHVSHSSENRTEMRELSSAEAKLIIDRFEKTVKTDKNDKQLKARNRLISFLLLTLGIRLSELIQITNLYVERIQEDRIHDHLKIFVFNRA